MEAHGDRSPSFAMLRILKTALSNFHPVAYSLELRRVHTKDVSDGGKKAPKSVIGGTLRSLSPPPS